MYANPKVGIMPHTVQAYSLEADPAPVYGNVNFEYMMEWMFYEAKRTPDREVVFYGETNYWSTSSFCPFALCVRVCLKRYALIGAMSILAFLCFCPCMASAA